MSFYFRLFGGLALVVSALILSREYSAYCKRRILEYDGFIALLSHAEGKIAKYLSSGESLWRDFNNDALLNCGFLVALQDGETPISAFEKCESRLRLSQSTKARLREFFSGWGREYRERELLLLSSFKEEIAAEGMAEKEKLDKSVRISSALLIGGALALMILII